VSAVAARIARVPLVVFIVWAALAAIAPLAMASYRPYSARRGIGSSCFSGRVTFLPGGPQPSCPTVAEAHHATFGALMTDAALRSLALLLGAAVLALVVGGLLGIAAGLLRRRAVASGAIVGVTTLLAAVPSFFVAYFLQISVIVAGNAAGRTLLPVFGFGYDAHLVLPLLSISLPAVAYTAQLTAARMNDVLDADFVTTANAKGLLGSHIVRVHVLPHVRPVLLEALGSGLRVSVASLPIVEFLFNWNGIGALSLEAVALKDAPAFVFCAVVLVSVFAVLSAVADLSRPRALFAR
jgi:peptide/nickel transport system permease protein